MNYFKAHTISTTLLASLPNFWGTMAFSQLMAE